MTSRVRASLLAACLVAATAHPPVAAAQQRPQGIWPNPRECGNIDPSTQRQCISRRLARKEAELTRLYPRALASVRDRFSKYRRENVQADPRRLEIAQAEWRRFVDNHCTVAAAFVGAFNSSFNDRYAECFEEELDRRIEFLRQIADGSYDL